MLPPMDITALSFSEFVQFIFDRPVQDHPWWHTEWMTCTPVVEGGISHEVGNRVVLLDYLTQLFEHADHLPEDYTRCQIEQGFWFISVMDGLDPPLWDVDLPLSLRQQCIEAMECLFTKLFAWQPLETASLVWWYNFAKGYDLNEGQPTDDDDAAIQQTMFDTICRVLWIDSSACRESALAGLVALKHVRTAETIDEFLRESPDIDDVLQAEFTRLRSRALKWQEM